MRAKKCQILCALAISAFLLLLPARCAAQESTPLATAIHLGSADLHIQEDRSFKLSPNALQVARIIRVESDIARLSELTTGKNPAQVSYHLTSVNMSPEQASSIAMRSTSWGPPPLLDCPP